MSWLGDKTTFVLAGIVIILCFISFQKTGSIPWNAAKNAGSLFSGTVVKILLGFMIGAILPGIIPKEIVENWLSARSG